MYELPGDLSHGLLPSDRQVIPLAEQGFTCPFRQMVLLGQGRGKMLECNGTISFGRSGRFLCFA
jgi:hypothetical protein